MKNIVFDIDGTLIKGQSQKILIKYLFKKKEIGLLYLISILVWFILYKCKLVNNPKKVMEFGFRLMKGRNIKSVEELMKDFYSQELKNYLDEETISYLKDHQTKGDRIVLLTNVLMPLAQTVGKNLGVSDVLATRLEVKDNIYTGRLIGDIIYGDKKLQYGKEYLLKMNQEYNKTYYYADHRSDIAMLSYVDESRVVHPDKNLHKYAYSKGWKIVAK